MTDIHDPNLDQFIQDTEPENNNFTFSNHETMQSFQDITQQNLNNQINTESKNNSTSPHKIYNNKETIGRLTLRNNKE